MIRTLTLLRITSLRFLTNPLVPTTQRLDRFERTKELKNKTQEQKDFEKGFENNVEN